MRSQIWLGPLLYFIIIFLNARNRIFDFFGYFALISFVYSDS